MSARVVTAAVLLGGPIAICCCLTCHSLHAQEVAPPPPAVVDLPPAPEQLQIAREAHPWMGHAAGSWREERIVSETLEPDGTRLSRRTASQTEVLTSVADDHCVVHVRSTVDLGGRDFQGNWQPRVLPRLLESQATILGQTQLPAEEIVVEGLPHQCEVWEIRYQQGPRQMVDRISYAAVPCPVLLRRVTSELGSQADQPPLSVKTTRVTATSLPYLLGERQLNCRCLETVRAGEKGRSVKITFSSREVPGGEVASWSTQWDAEGNQLGSSVMKLEGFGHDAVITNQRVPLLPGRRLRQERRDAREGHPVLRLPRGVEGSAE